MQRVRNSAIQRNLNEYFVAFKKSKINLIQRLTKQLNTIIKIRKHKTLFCQKIISNKLVLFRKCKHFRYKF